MAKARVNWKLIIVLLIAVIIVGVTAVGLRKWFRARTLKGGYVLGKQAYEEKDWDAAAQKLGNYLSVQKDDVEILMLYADAQTKRRPKTTGNIQMATESYRQVLRLEPDNLKATDSIVDLYLNGGAFSGAQNKARDFLEVGEDVEIRVKLAGALLGQRKFKEASGELLYIIEKYPDHIPAYELLGLFSNQRPDDFPESGDYWFQKAVDNNPDDAFAYIIRGSWYIKTNQTQLGLTDLEKALEMEIEKTDIKLRLAKEFVDAKKYDEAQKILDEVEAQEPDNIMLWQVRGVMAVSIGDKELMESVADEALNALDYMSWDYLGLAVELYISSEKYDKAQNSVERMAKQEGARNRVLFYRGLLQSKKGNNLEALKLWKEAVDIGYKTPRARLLLADAYSRTGDMESAIQQLRALVSESPDNFSARLSLAQMLMHIGDMTGSSEQALTALQLKPDSVEAMKIYTEARMRVLTLSGVSADSKLWADLEEKLDAFADLSQETPDVMFSRFQVALKKQALDDANDILVRMVEQYPESMEVLLANVEMLRINGDEKRAEEKLQDTVEEFPQEIQPVKYLVLLLHSQNRINDCVETLGQAIERVEIPQSKLQLGKLMSDLARGTKYQNKAISTLEKLSSDYPDSISLKRRLLSFKSIYSDKEKAQKIIDSIKELEGKDGWQWKYEQAKIWFISDEFTEHYANIIVMLKESLVNDPANQEVRVLLAGAYAKNNDTISAINTYKQALARSPEHPVIIAGLVATLYKANEIDEAERLLKQAASGKISSPALEKLRLQSFIRKGDYASASEYLKEAVKNDPDDTDSMLALTMFYIEDDQFENAEANIQTLKQKLPDSKAVQIAEIELALAKKGTAKAIRICNEIVQQNKDADSYVIRARTFLSLGAKDKAEADLIKATDIEPKDEEAWIILSNFYASSGNIERSARIIDKALSLMPDNIKVLKRAIIAFGSSDKYEDKLRSGQLIDKTLEISPDDPEIKLLKARYLLSLGNKVNNEIAADLLQNVLEDFPGLIDGWILLSQLKFSNAEYDAAIDIANQGLNYSPDDKQLTILKARSYAVISPTQAVGLFEKLYQDDPNNIDMMINYANTLISSGRNETAIELLEKNIEHIEGDQNRLIKAMLAKALEKTGQTEKSKQLFSELEKQAGDDPMLLSTKAQLLIEQQKWYDLLSMVCSWVANNPDHMKIAVEISGQLAMEDDLTAKKVSEEMLKKLLEIQPENYQVLNMLGMVLHSNGKPGEAVQVYEKIILLQPDNIVAINNLAWIKCEEQGELEKALELANSGLKKEPNYEDLCDTRGVIYYRMGENEKAIKDFLRAIELIPVGNPLAAGPYYHLGRTYFDMDEKSKALEHLNTAVELGLSGKTLSADEISNIRRMIYKIKNQ